MRDFTYPIPAGVSEIDLGALHALIETAGVGLDGVSRRGDQIVVTAEDAPDVAIKKLDWAALAPVTAEETPSLDPQTIKAALKVALSGTAAQKAKFAADHLA